MLRVNSEVYEALGLWWSVTTVHDDHPGMSVLIAQEGPHPYDPEKFGVFQALDLTLEPIRDRVGDC